MKKCPKCGTENPGTASVCQNCTAPIDGVPDYQNDSNSFFEKINKREKFAKIIKLVLIPLYYVIYIVFYIKCILIDRSIALPLSVPIFFPIAYLLLMFKSDSLFRIKHALDIDSPEKVQLSDWYYLSSKISACLVLALGLFMVIYVYFCIKTDGTTGININIR